MRETGTLNLTQACTLLGSRANPSTLPTFNVWFARSNATYRRVRRCPWSNLVLGGRNLATTAYQVTISVHHMSFMFCHDATVATSITSKLRCKHRDTTPIMENQMENNMECPMRIGSIMRSFGVRRAQSWLRSCQTLLYHKGSFKKPRPLEP